MIRLTLRFAGLLLLALAFIFVIYDGMKSIADRNLYLTKTSQVWIEINAASLQTAQAKLDDLTPGLWLYVIGPVLAQPAAAIFAGLGVLLILLGRKKRRLIGYARD